jgi:hypothetical protein
MTTKTEIWNSYEVKFVFHYAIISCCVFAEDEEEAVVMGSDILCYDLGISPELLSDAQDISIELLDEDIL